MQVCFILIVLVSGWIHTSFSNLFLLLRLQKVTAHHNVDMKALIIDIILNDIELNNIYIDFFLLTNSHIDLYMYI